MHHVDHAAVEMPSRKSAQWGASSSIGCQVIRGRPDHIPVRRVTAEVGVVQLSALLRKTQMAHFLCVPLVFQVQRFDQILPISQQLTEHKFVPTCNAAAGNASSPPCQRLAWERCAHDPRQKQQRCLMWVPKCFRKLVCVGTNDAQGA